MFSISNYTINVAITFKVPSMYAMVVRGARMKMQNVSNITKSFNIKDIHGSYHKLIELKLKFSAVNFDLNT